MQGFNCGRYLLLCEWQVKMHELLGLPADSSEVNMMLSWGAGPNVVVEVFKHNP
jgi:hypothetical protein